MNVWNKSKKVICIGGAAVMPGDSIEVADGVASSPALRGLERAGRVEIGPGVAAAGAEAPKGGTGEPEAVKPEEAAVEEAKPQAGDGAKPEGEPKQKSKQKKPEG